jgi:glycine/D-amino acid oxidase-like deaminating enzyme
MNSKHYDVAIIGESLAARIAAALLAKSGIRVLLLSQREPSSSTWGHSSLFLEKILGILGGRDCFVAQQQIQVLTCKARITLSNDIPLDGELKREFGESSGSATAHWLQQLQALGNQLEDFFWENGGLPWPTFKAGARFRLLCLRHKVNLKQLDKPITQTLEQLPRCATGFISDLLQGLAMVRIEQLSRNRAALVWAQAMRPENLKQADFCQLLNKRFDQFHGLRAPLDELESLEYNGSRCTGGKFKGGPQFTATYFLIGDTEWFDRFAPGKIEKPARSTRLTRLMTSNLHGHLSPLLATRIICGGDVPLRLAIEQQGDQLIGQVVSAGESDQTQLRKQLEPVLPFVRYQFSETSGQIDQQNGRLLLSQPQQLTRLPLQLGANLYCADNDLLLAEMGSGGAALLGWTLAEKLAGMLSER